MLTCDPSTSRIGRLLARLAAEHAQMLALLRSGHSLEEAEAILAGRCGARGAPRAPTCRGRVA